MLTLEERERRAYISGRTEEAALLAVVIDNESEQVKELEYEIRSLKDEVRELQDELGAVGD